VPWCLTDTKCAINKNRFYLYLSNIAECLIVEIRTYYTNKCSTIRRARSWIKWCQSRVRFIVIHDCLICINYIFVFYVELHCPWRANCWDSKVNKIWTNPIIKFSHVVLTKLYFDVLREEIREIAENKDLVTSLLKTFIWLNLIYLDFFLKVEVEVWHLNLVVIFNEKSYSYLPLIWLGLSHADYCRWVWCNFLFNNFNDRKSLLLTNSESKRHPVMSGLKYNPRTTIGTLPFKFTL
jgi:hypothetical protein